MNQLADKKAKDYLKFYRFHGVELDYDNGSGQFIGTCPDCQKGEHFYVLATTGQYHCHFCGFEGNTYAFMGYLLERGRNRDLGGLSDSRRIRERCLHDHQIIKHPLTGDWAIPTFTNGGTPNNLYTYRLSVRKGRYEIRSSPGCNQQLYRYWLITREQTTIYVCEGHWDTLALVDILSAIRYRKDPKTEKGKYLQTTNPDNSLLKTTAVVGAPGAVTFKKDWLFYLRNRHVRLLFDNDESGQKGMDRLVKMIEKNRTPVSSLQRIQWKERDHNDIRDFLTV
jgi:hypothetical protein